MITGHHYHRVPKRFLRCNPGVVRSRGIGPYTVMDIETMAKDKGWLKLQANIELIYGVKVTPGQWVATHGRSAATRSSISRWNKAYKPKARAARALKRAQDAFDKYSAEMNKRHDRKVAMMAGKLKRKKRADPRSKLRERLTDAGDRYIKTRKMKKYSPENYDRDRGGPFVSWRLRRREAFKKYKETLVNMAKNADRLRQFAAKRREKKK
jgi:hypothetical protein